MTIGERVLLIFSRPAHEGDYSDADLGETKNGALDALRRVYPDFSDLVAGKRVVDFGCGVGNQSIALVKEYSCSVVGLDSNRATLKKAAENFEKSNLSSVQLSFVENISPRMRGKFDVVISHDSFEHFSEPRAVLYEMASLLNDSGILLITFGPPWFAPYGSHMHFFCRFPWVNLLFSEKSVMAARSHFRRDGATSYEDVESGLNKMTIAKFESIVSSCDLELTYKKYECVKGINWLSRIPMLRELFINHVTVALSRPSNFTAS